MAPLTPSQFMIVAGLTGVAALCIFAALYLRLRSRRRRAAARQRADERLRAAANEFGWACELRPSPKIWYRLRGTSEQGVRWQMIQSPPEEGGGPQWWTDDVNVPELLLEIMPASLYEAAKTIDGPVPGLQLASKKLVSTGSRTKLYDEALNLRLAAVSVVPSLADQLLSPEIEACLLACGRAPLKLSLGFPNLRLRLERARNETFTLKAVVDLGLAFAHAYRAVNQNQQAV